MSSASPTLLTPTTADAPLLDPECLPDYDLIVTEDETPVESYFSERQPTLLTDALHASWSFDGRPFQSMGNVGLFYAVKQPPLVPDYLLSLDVEWPDNPWPKENRSYFLWKTRKPPDLVIEIVSNTVGGEVDVKPPMYAKIGVAYYVIHDPLNELGGGVVRAFALRGGLYEPVPADFFAGIGLGLTLWTGHYAGMRSEWLRWCDRSGRLLLTGEELAIQERQRADQEQQQATEQRQRAEQQQRRAEQQQQLAEQLQQRAAQQQQLAEQQQQRAEQQQQRAERLAAQLRSLGIEPTE